MLSKLCFIHIPRSSGTNFIGRLVEIYGAENSAPYNSMEAYTSGDFNRNYLLYGGHTNWKIRNILGPEFKYATMLSEPINRAISHIIFIRDSGLVVDTEIDDLVFNPHPFVQAVANYQVHALSPSRDIKEAIENLKQLDWYGIKEYHQASWETFLRKFEIQSDVKAYGNYRGLSASMSSKSLAYLTEILQDSITLYEFAKKEFLKSL